MVGILVKRGRELILFPTLFLFLTINYGCEKDIFMKESEKQALNILNGKCKKTKEISFTVTQKFYEAANNVPNDGTFFVFTPGLATSYFYTLKPPIFVIGGYSDYLNNYVNAREIEQNTYNLKSFTNANNFHKDFFVIFKKTSAISFQSKHFNLLPITPGFDNPFINIQAIQNNTYKDGSIIYIQSLKSKLDTKEYILFYETSLVCNTMTIDSFLLYTFNENPTLRNISINFEDILTTIPGAASLPKGNIADPLNFPVYIQKNNIFGNIHTDSIDLRQYANPMNLNQRIVNIPLNVKMKDISLVFPYIMNVMSYKIILTIEI